MARPRRDDPTQRLETDAEREARWLTVARKSGPKPDDATKMQWILVRARMLDDEEAARAAAYRKRQHLAKPAKPTKHR